MGTQTHSTLHPMLWLAAASVTAVSLAGVARLAGFMPGSAEAPSPVAAAAPADAPASASVAAPVARPVAPPRAEAAPAHAARLHRPATETARPAPRMADNPPPVAAAVPEAMLLPKFALTTNSSRALKERNGVTPLNVEDQTTVDDEPTGRVSA